MYGGQQTHAYFEHAKGFSLDQFTLACFLLRGMYLQFPGTLADDRLAEFGMPRALLRAVFDLISLPHVRARAEALRLRSGPGHTAYKRSLFRTYPCVEFDQGFIAAPLPDLVTRRGSTGIFYDVIDGPENVKNEIAQRFEVYCRDFLAAAFTDLPVSGDYKYRLRKGNDFDTPDVLIRQDNELAVICECKATRMSYEARFAEDPIVADPRGYGEMARGVFQIWRFVSHKRRGLLQEERFRPDVTGVLLTLDPWLSMSDRMIGHILTKAEEMATERDPEILPEDRIPVTFCPVDDLEQTVSRATSTSFLAAVRGATEERYRGWMLPNVHDQVAPTVMEDNEYPFAERIAEVLPWWNRFGGGQVRDRQV